MNCRRFAVPAFPALAVAAVLVPAIGHATWSHDPYGGNPVVVLPLNQGHPATVSDGAGGAIIVWHDADGIGFDIYGQHLDRDGNPLFKLNGISLCSTAGDQLNPVAISDGAGGVFVAWEDSRAGNTDIYVSRMGGNGSEPWTTNGVGVCTLTSTQSHPALASDGAGGVIVAWDDLRSGNADIYAQRLGPTGTPLWAANGVPVCTVAGSQTIPLIDGEGAGGAVLTWYDLRGADPDVYAQRLSSTGTLIWTASGAPVFTGGGYQTAHRIISDGSGGAILSWDDSRSGTYDIYAQRLRSNGGNLWGPPGVAVCAAASDQLDPVMVPDGTGGAIIAWDDFRNAGLTGIYAQRITSAGTPAWTVDGVSLVSNVNLRFPMAICSDGNSGAIVAVRDSRGGTDAIDMDLYAQRVNLNGAVQWSSGGVAIALAYGDPSQPTIAPDGRGGAILAWPDPRPITDTDVYAQRVDTYGLLGDPSPVIAGIHDVPGDQGGFVNVQWLASYADALPYNVITTYDVWRQVPAAMARAALAEGAVLADPGAASTALPGRRVLRAAVSGGQTYFWELIGSQKAKRFAGYSLTVPTTADSTPAGNPRTTYEVVANSGGIAYWESAPDSGYSVDDLAPATPAPFTLHTASGVSTLSWGANTEPDLAGYRLYRGPDAGFVAGPATLIAFKSDPGYFDVGPDGAWYKLAAVDLHGNESPDAVVGPVGSVAVGDEPAPGELLLHPVRPNPGRGQVGFGFALPREADVSLDVFDARGRRVASLAHGRWPAGEQRLVWDGRDLQGRDAGSGLFFARLQCEGVVRVARLSRMR